MKKSIRIIILVIAAIGFFYYMNNVGPRFVGSYYLTDGIEWEDVSINVTEGEEDKFTVELDGPQKIKATYDGKTDFRAELTLTNSNGETGKYELLIYSEMDTIRDTTTTVTELIPLE